MWAFVRDRIPLLSSRLSNHSTPRSVSVCVRCWPRNCLCHETKSSAWQSVVCLSAPCVPLTHTHLNCLRRWPLKSPLIPKQSLRVWLCGDESCWEDRSRVWQLFSESRFDSYIKGFPLWQGLWWGLLNPTVVHLRSGPSDVSLWDAVEGLVVELVFAHITISQMLCLPVSRLSSVKTWITAEFFIVHIFLFLQHRGRQSTGDRGNCWGAGRLERSTSAMMLTRAVSWLPSRCHLILFVKTPAR